MVAIEGQKPLCPVCHKADQVKKLDNVYNEGMQRFVPPPLPGKSVSMMRYMTISMVLVGLCIFFIIILVGSESFGQGFNYTELALVLITLVCIVAALILSYHAFTMVVRGDMEAQKHYPAWERAMERWGRLRYCSRDNIIFDLQTGKTVSEEELASLQSTEVEKQVAQQSTSLAH